MLYTFTKTNDVINGNLAVNSPDNLAFIYETIALSEQADVKIENAGDEILSALFGSIGVQTSFSESSVHLSKKEADVSKALIKDFSGCPQFAVPFAIVCAAKGILADLKGLERLTKENGTDSISFFQKEMYRFNINTDFCDYSKLKIYNNKEMKTKTKPVNLAAFDFLNIPFIPLAMLFGKIEIEMSADFEEKNTELFSLLPALNLKFEKH